MEQALAPNDVPRDSERRRRWIVTELRLRGRSLSVLADEHGVNVSSVWAPLVRPSAYFENVIAQELGLTVQQLFPERFAANGTRLFPTRPQHETRSRRALARKVGQHG